MEGVSARDWLNDAGFLERTLRYTANNGEPAALCGLLRHNGILLDHLATHHVVSRVRLRG